MKPLSLLIFLCLLGILGCHVSKAAFAADYRSAIVMPAQVIDTPRGVLEKDISEGFKQLLEAAIVDEATEREISFAVMISDAKQLSADYELGDIRAKVILVPKVSFEYEERSVTERYFGQEVQRRVTFIKSVRLDLQVQENVSDPKEEEGQYALLFSLQKRESIGHRLDEASYAGVSLAMSSLAADAAKETLKRLFPEPEEEDQQPRSRKR